MIISSYFDYILKKILKFINSINCSNYLITENLFMHISLTYKQPSNSKQAFWKLCIMMISYCLIAQPILAKNNVDSLRKIIVQQKVDSNTLNAYNAITQHYFSAPNESLAYFTTQGYDVSYSIKKVFNMVRIECNLFRFTLDVEKTNKN